MKKLFFMLFTATLPLVLILLGCETGKKTIKAINGGQSIDEMLDEKEEGDDLPPIPPPGYPSKAKK